MTAKLTSEQVAILIRARQIAKDNGIDADADIKRICEHAGISRKTGYQWAEKHLGQLDSQPAPAVTEELSQLKSEHEKRRKDNEQLRFENKGWRLAWDIHEVDDLIAGKKKSIAFRQKKKQ